MPYNIPGIHIVVQSDRNHIVVPLTEAVEVTPDPPYVASIIFWTETATSNPTLQPTVQVLDQYGNGMNGQTVTFTVTSTGTYKALMIGFIKTVFDINSVDLTKDVVTINGDFLPASGIDNRDGVAIAPMMEGDILLAQFNSAPVLVNRPQFILRASCGGVIAERLEYAIVSGVAGDHR